MVMAGVFHVLLLELTDAAEDTKGDDTALGEIGEHVALELSVLVADEEADDAVKHKLPRVL